MRASRVFACAIACVVSSAAFAQSYPSRPLRLIVAFAPGGSVDVIARIVGQKLTDRLEQQVVIDNRPGAGGNVSAEIVARAAPDGYTLYIGSASVVANASLYRRIAYDPIRDFAPVTLLASAQSVLVVHPGFPAKTVKDIIALAKKSPGKIDYASPGSGSSGHLTMELFKVMAGVNVVHVPYKLMSQLQSDVIAGLVPLAFSTIPGALPHIQAGRMLPVAVSGARRSPALPNVPTIAEAAVPGYEATTWYPVLAPAGTPKTIVEKLNAELVAIVKARDLQERFVAMGVDPIGSTPEELAAHMKRELRKWAKVVELSGARVD